MATRNDKIHVWPGTPCGHDWNDFLAALAEMGLERSENELGFWTQIVEPRSTITSPEDLWPNQLIVEFGMAGYGLMGPWERTVRAWHSNCKSCGREMVSGTDICKHCKRDRVRQMNAARSRRYRYRAGLVKHRFIETCPVCGKEFRPKRSTARFCSSRCRVASHRAAKEAKD